jgi:hypothetical protein
MTDPAPPSSAIVPVAPVQKLAVTATDKAVSQLLPEATPEQRRAVATLVAPWAEKLVRALDDLVRVPGTKFGVGLDAVLGFFFPGAGDVVTGIGAISLLFLAIRHKVPTVAIGRMLVNIGVDTLVGSVPVLGDLFDLFWKSNRRNLEIIESYKSDPQRQPKPSDYALVGLGVLLVVASVVMPLVMVVFFGASMFALVGSLLALVFGGGGGQ